MNGIWFLSKDRNTIITGFNTVERDGIYELWITEINGSSRKLAEGEKAHELEEALLDIAWNTSPAIISDGRGRFATNVNTQQEELSEVGE